MRGPEMEDEVKAIIAFVRERVKTGNPPQYGDIRKQFHWSQTKFTRNWKKAKQYLTTKPPTESNTKGKQPNKRYRSKSGYPRYYVKQSYRKQAEKFLFIESLAEAVTEGNLQAVEISDEQFSSAIKKKAESLRPMFDDNAWKEAKEVFEAEKTEVEQEKSRSGLLRTIKKVLSTQHEKSIPFEEHPMVKLARFMSLYKNSAKARELEYLIGLLKLAGYIKINVIYSKGDPSPQLSDGDVAKLLTMFLTTWIKTRRKGPIHIVATFSTPELPESVWEKIKA
mgnify:CR=1 FL=1